MKLDQWTQFNLSREDQAFFRAFASPAAESSIVKDVPIGALAEVQPLGRPPGGVRQARGEGAAARAAHTRTVIHMPPSVGRSV